MKHRSVIQLAVLLPALLFASHSALAQTARVHHLTRSTGGVQVAASSGKLLHSTLGRARSGYFHRYVAASKDGAAAAPSILASMPQTEEPVVMAQAQEGLTAGLAPGVTEESEAVSEVESVPTEFALKPNYPNPFNPRTTIAFDLPSRAEVKLVIYDVLGRQVRVLVDGTRAAGTHEVVFEASDLPSGTYLVRLEMPQGSFVQTMQLVK